MTRPVLRISIALAVGVVIGIFMDRDPGYVLVAYGQYSVETSLWVAAVLILVAIAVAWLVYRFAHMVLGSGKIVKGMVSKQRQLDASVYAIQGLERESEGELEKALTAYRFAIDRDQKSALLFLHSAKIANRAGNLAQRDLALAEAETKFPKLSKVIGINRVQLQYEAGQHAVALDTLEELASKLPRSVTIQRLKARLYRHERNWPEVIDALTQLHMKNLSDSEQLENELKKAYCHRLEELAGAETDLSQLKKAWKKVPRAMQEDSKLVESYCKALSKLGHDAVAAEVLRRRLRNAYDESLVILFGSLEIPAEERIKALNVWTDSHSDSAGAHLALGRLLALTCDFDGARIKLKKSLDIQPSTESFKALAQIEMQLNNHEKASELLLQSATCRELAELGETSPQRLAP